MKDFLGNQVNTGDYFAYPLTIGRSCQMAVFQFKEATETGVKARPITRSYKYSYFKYKKWDSKAGTLRDMTQEEKEKVDNKCSFLKMFEERALKLDNYKED